MIEDLGYNAGGWRVERHPRLLRTPPATAAATSSASATTASGSRAHCRAAPSQRHRLVLGDLGYHAGAGASSATPLPGGHHGRRMCRHHRLRQRRRLVARAVGAWRLRGATVRDAALRLRRRPLGRPRMAVRVAAAAPGRHDGRPPRGHPRLRRRRRVPVVALAHGAMVPRMYRDGADRPPMKWWGWGEERLLHPRRQARAGAFHRAPPRARRAPPGHPADRVRRSGDPAVRPARRAEVGPRGRRGRRTRLDGRARPGRPCAREEPHGSGSPAPRIGRVADVVVRPATEEEVVAVVTAAIGEDAVVIPFGGQDEHLGQPRAGAGRDAPCGLDRHGPHGSRASVDATSQLARVQAGVFGPNLERQLNARGWTCGRFPDSFTHSTLGWIATRSSGMQSDRYGDVAELTRGLRVVTPSGVLVVRPVPSTSTGPSVREMVLAARAGSASSPRRRSRSAGCRPSARSWATSSHLGGRPRGDARHRGKRGLTLGHACVRPARDRFLVRHPRRPDAGRPAQVEPAGLPQAQGLGSRGDVPVVHRLEGSAPAWPPRPARRPSASPSATARSASARARASSTTKEVRHALHPRLPARPRRTRRRLEPSAPWGELTVYDNVMAAGHGAFRARRAGLPDVPSVPLLPRGACLYFTFAINPPAGGARRCMAWSSGRSSRRSSTRARRSPITTPSARSTPVARGGHLEPRGGDAAGALRGFRPGGTSTRARSSRGARRAPGQPAEVDFRAQMQPRMGWSGSSNGKDWHGGDGYWDERPEQARDPPASGFPGQWRRVSWPTRG